MRQKREETNNKDKGSKVLPFLFPLFYKTFEYTLLKEKAFAATAADVAAIMLPPPLLLFSPSKPLFLLIFDIHSYFIQLRLMGVSSLFLHLQSILLPKLINFPFIYFCLPLHRYTIHVHHKLTHL